MRTQHYFFVILTFVGFAQSANILGLFSNPSKSHFIVFRKLLEKLAERGHQVDVLSHFPRNEPLKGYTDYSIKRQVDTYATDINIEFVKSMSLPDLLRIVNVNCGTPTCHELKNTTSLKKLLKTTKKYDLIITEIFITDCLLGFANIFNAPIIALISSVNLPWSSDVIGLPDNPSYIPNYFSPYTEDMSYLKRLTNTLVLHLTKLWYQHYPTKEANLFIEEVFGKSAKKVEEIRKNISLVMVNTHFSLQQSRPIPPNFIEIGGIHLKSNYVLPREFEDYLKTDLKGVVYLSFGTLFKSEKFPDYLLKPFFESLGEIPYKILWKGERSNVAKHINIPSNIHFVSWMPQAELLCHPNLKLFISHCGLASAQEAINCGKPVLAIPIWVDQLSTAQIISEKGLGLSIPIFEITKIKLQNALKQILENPIYTQNAQRASELFKDRPMSALDTAVYWTEYVIKHKGAKHLRSKGADIPFYQFYCLDIALTLCLVCLILFWSVYKFLKWVSGLKLYFRIWKTKLH